MKGKALDFHPARRKALRNFGLLALMGISVTVLPVAKAAKVSKAAMLYQTRPLGSEACANCVHFEPGPTAKAQGACSVVKGSISPHGYCIAYSPRA